MRCAFAGATLAVACGQTESSPPAETGGSAASAIGGNAATAGSSGSLDASVPLDAELPVADASTDCAPERTYGAITSCCNGQPCLGDCFEADGVSTCVCGETLDGCTAPEACCNVYGQSCIPPESCSGGPP